MASTTERLGIVETKVENLDSKIDELRIDVKEVHECLDRTGESLHRTLKEMSEGSNLAHQQLANKISALENFKQKWSYMIMGGIAVGSWLAGHATAINFFK